MPTDQPRSMIDSPRMASSTLSDVPEDQPMTPVSARLPYYHQAVTGSATTFKPATSTTSLSSTGAVGGAPSRTPSAAGQRTPSGLTRSGTARSTSGDSTAGGVATPRNQRSGSPATLKEREREPREGKDEKRESGKEREREGGRAHGAQGRAAGAAAPADAPDTQHAAPAAREGRRARAGDAHALEPRAGVWRDAAAWDEGA